MIAVEKRIEVKLAARITRPEVVAEIDEALKRNERERLDLLELLRQRGDYRTLWREYVMNQRTAKR